MPIPTDVLIGELLGVASNFVGNGGCLLVVQSWKLTGCTGVIDVSAGTMGVRVGSAIVIRLILFNHHVPL